jgi:hypothetical protein
MGIFDRLFKKKEKSNEVEERNLFNLKIGDIITYDLEDYELVSKLTYNDSGYRWFAYQMISGNETKWLSVEMDDELELGIYEKVSLTLEKPLPKTIQYDGVNYTLDESGTAQVIGEGRGQNVNGKSLQYADYCDDTEEQFISVEVWGSEVEVSKGYEIDEYEIKVIAGS